MKKIAIIVIILVLALDGCTILNRSYKLGTEASINKNWDEAVEHYERAVLEDPENSVYRLALLRAKIAASLFYLHEARKLADQKKKEEALAAYEKALNYDPANRAIADEVRLLTGEKVEEKEPEEIKIEPPVKLKIKEKKMNLKFVNASLRSIFQALAKTAQINIIFDNQFRDAPFTIDLVDMSFEQALNNLCLASKNFYSVVDEKTVIVAPDQPVKRVQYELNAIKTFYLSNIKAQEVQGPLRQMLRTQFQVPNIIVDNNLNTVTIRAAPYIVELAERVIRSWDKPKGEVVIDLEIMEVSRTKLRQLGLDFEQYIVGLRYSGPEGTTDTGWFNLRDIDFKKSENYQLTLPSALIQFLEQDADTKIIQSPRLRGIEGEIITYLVGDKVPIPRTTFTPIAAGGVSQQPVTSFDYEDVGIDVKITPKIHAEREITLELEIKMKSIGGTGIADIPIIATREVKNIIRLRDGETNLLAGLLKDEERKTLRGIAGLKNLPILGSLFSSTDETITQTDVILTITPYIIRTIPVSPEDLKPVWANVGGAAAGGGSVSPEEEEEMPEVGVMRERILTDRQRAREEAAQNQIFLQPASFEVPEGREFRISVNLRSQEQIANMSFNINFNADVLNLKEVVKGGFVDQLGKTPSFLQNIDSASGTCTIGFSSPDVSRGVRGTGRLATLVFEAKSEGESTVSIVGVNANAPGGHNISFETRESRVVVR